MKILYAASNNQNARIQLSRFLRMVNGHQIKVAAYKASSPKGVNIDWTLDALLNIYKPELLSLNNDNMVIYYEQIKSFGPDLVVSDLEYFTSYAATQLNIPVWQYSSSLLGYGLREKYDLGLFKYYAHSLNRDPMHTQRTINIIDNSARNLICSHFSDLAEPPELLNNYEWVRPYHQIAKVSVPCQHRVVAALSTVDASILDLLKKHPDSVVFMESGADKYHNVYVKDIGIEDEYYCNLGNSPLFVCQGQASYLADAFYNKKIPLIYPNYEDADSLVNSQLSKKFGLGHVMNPLIELSGFADLNTQPRYQDSIKYLHEKIEEL